MRIDKHFASWALAVSVVAMAACNPVQEDTPTRFVSSVSPRTSLSPLPPTPLPSPEVGKGGVHGTLSLAKFPLNLADAELYLGDVFAADDGDFSMYYFDQTVNPKAQWVDAQSGEFVFEAVNPGEYVLILWWDITGWAPVYRAGTTEGIHVVVIPDRVTELGLIESDQ